jgi:hypothetical protein
MLCYPPSILINNFRNWNILDWNIRGKNTQVRWNDLANNFREKNCNVIFLQETKRDFF